MKKKLQLFQELRHIPPNLCAYVFTNYFESFDSTDLLSLVPIFSPNVSRLSQHIVC